MFRQSSKSGLILPRSSMVNPYAAQGLPAIYGQISKSLRLYFDLSDGTGSYMRCKANSGYFGTLTAGASGNSIEQMWSNGRPGGVDFDGVNDYITMNSKLATSWLHGRDDVNNFKFTLHTWVRVDWQTDGLHCFFDETGVSSVRAGVSCFYDNRSSGTLDSSLRFMIGARYQVNNNIIIINGPDNSYPNTNDPVCITITHDQSLANTNCLVYVNGQHTLTGNKTAITPSTDQSYYNMRFGASSVNGNYNLPGGMYLWAAHDEVLTPDQIASLYEAERRLFNK